MEKQRSLPPTYMLHWENSIELFKEKASLDTNSSLRYIVCKASERKIQVTFPIIFQTLKEASRKLKATSGSSASNSAKNRYKNYIPCEFVN